MSGSAHANVINKDMLHSLLLYFRNIFLDTSANDKKK